MLITGLELTKKKCIAVLQRQWSELKPVEGTKMFGFLRCETAFLRYVFGNA